MNNKAKKKEPKHTDKGYLAFLKSIGEFFRKRRIAMGFRSAEVFANHIEMDVAQYLRYERGSEPLTMATFYRILKGLNLSDLDAEENIFNLRLDPSSAETVLSSEVESQVISQVKILNGEEEAKKLNPTEIQRMGKILIVCSKLLSKNDVALKAGFRSKNMSFRKVFGIAFKNNWIAMIYPDSPHRNDQKYYTTEAGKNVIKPDGHPDQSSDEK